MFVLDQNNQKLFSGSKQACKQYVRQNKVMRYRIATTFDEKVKELPQLEEVEPVKEEPTTFFNRIFK